MSLTTDFLPEIEERDVVLTQSEVCQMLRVSRDLLRKLGDTGQIAFVRLGTSSKAHRRYRLSAVRAFLEKSTN